MIITSIPDLSLQYDEALGLLRAEWASGADMRTFQHSAAQVLGLMRQLEVRRVVLDMNSFPDISVYDQMWLGTHWMPGLVQLPLDRLVLAINRRRVHNQLAIDSLLALARPFIKFDVQFFQTSVPGLQWLCDYSDRLPALLVEWDALHGATPPPAAPGLAEPRPWYLPRP